MKLSARGVSPLAKTRGPTARNIGRERFERFRLMPWWRQGLLERARVLVVGAGTLGNEVLKNLALLGFGNILLVDRDIIEPSNLSRSVLFREEDLGRPKALVARERLRELYPPLRVRAIHGDITTDVGQGVFRWADIITSAVDNREARVWINEACWRFEKPWIDGGIEALEGVVRFFLPPGGACYECTMSEADWALLKQRKSCSLLSRKGSRQGNVPTTPTTASVIAGIMCQEVVKHLHGLVTLAGKGYVFNGLTYDSYVVNYMRKRGCYAHEVAARVKRISKKSTEMSVAELVRLARRDLGPGAIVEFNNELASYLACKVCARKAEAFVALEKLDEEGLRCPSCKAVMDFESFHTANGEEPFARKSLSNIGVPPFDVLAGRLGMRKVYYEFTADGPRILGVRLRK